MPTPVSSTVARTRPDIQDSTQDFDLMANEAGFIANDLAPIFDVGQAGGNYGRIKLEQLLRRAKTARASGSDYNRITWGFEDAFFQTTENGLESPVDKRDENMYENYFDAEVVTADLVRHTVLLEREIRVRDLTFGNGSINGTAGSNWTDWAAATPIKDVHNARIRHWAATGLWPNTLVIPYQRFLDLQQIDEVLDRISASGAGDKIKPTDVTVQMIGQVFNLELLVGGSAMNSADLGATVDIDEIWTSTKAMVCRRVPKGSNNIRVPGIARSFHWGGDGSTPDGTQESYWDEKARSEIQRTRHETDERCTYPEMGEILTDLTG